MFNGRPFRIFLELLVGAAVCFVASLLIPLTLWRWLGEDLSALVILATTALIAAFVLLRPHHSHSGEPIRGAHAIESIG